jgi:tyrosyl-tRNA synthetase
MAPEQLEVLRSGAVEIIPEAGLDELLALDRPLRVKLGVDPSRPDLTLGHAVVLRKLRQFQDAGHLAVLIVGDFTARIGDPSGQAEGRLMLSGEEVAENARTYFAQAGKVIDVERAEIRGNAEWLESMDMEVLIRLAATSTVAQILEREDFRTRYQGGQPIGVVELLYPLFQGYDSVAVEADVELGGTDQTFNLLTGREVQRAFGQRPQIVLTMPLLVGTDGVRKMSKSLDNYVGLTDEPAEMFGRLMSVPDEALPAFVRLCSPYDVAEIEAVERGLREGTRHPNDEKRRLAREVVDLYHGADQGTRAEDRFDQVHREHQVPDDVPDAPIRAEAIRDGRIWLPRLLVEAGLANSNGEARRAVQQGGVRLDGDPLVDPDAELRPDQLAGKVLQVGRRRFVRLELPAVG